MLLSCAESAIDDFYYQVGPNPSTKPDSAARASLGINPEVGYGIDEYGTPTGLSTANTGKLYSQRNLSLQQLRRIIGRGLIDFKCLYQANGSLRSDADVLAMAGVVSNEAWQALQETVTEETTVEEYSRALDALRAEQDAVVEEQSRATGSYIPETTGILALEGVEGIESLIGYDNFGRDFDVTPQVSTGVICQDFVGQLENVRFDFCDNTVRLEHKLGDKFSIGWFISNSSFNGSYGTDDLRMGNSAGVSFKYSQQYYLGKGLVLRLSTRVQYGEMFTQDKGSYLTSYKAGSLDTELGFNVKGFSLSMVHSSGTHGSLSVLNHELALKPRDDWSWSMGYRTKL